MPVEVVLPVKVRVPDVEVTELLAKIVESPVTTRLLPNRVNPPPVPIMSRLLVIVIPPPEKLTDPADLVEVTFRGNRVEARVTV